MEASYWTVVQGSITEVGLRRGDFTDEAVFLQIVDERKGSALADGASAPDSIVLSTAYGCPQPHLREVILEAEAGGVWTLTDEAKRLLGIDNG